MPGALPSRILVHTATPWAYLEGQSDPPEWIEGEPGPHGGGEPTAGVPFACVLFLPQGGEQQDAYRPRVIKSPTLLYNPTRDLSRPGLVADGSPIVVTNEMELEIEASELAPWTGGTTVRWLAAGDGQPFGPPGQVIGVQLTVRQVRG